MFLLTLPRQRRGLPFRPEPVLRRAGLPGDPRFWLAIGLSACSVLAGSSLAPALVGIARGIGAGDALWPRLLVSLPALGVPLGALAFARFGHPGRDRAVLIAALYLYAACGVLGAVVTVAPVMLAARFLQGLTIAPLMLIALRMLGQGPAARGNMALQSTLMTASTVVVLLLAAGLAGVNWRLPFALNLLPLALVPAVRRLHATPTAAPAPAEPDPAPDRERDEPRLLPGMILAFLGMGTFFAIPTHAAPVLARMGHDNAGLAAGVIVASVVAASLGGLMVRRAGDGLRPGTALSLGYGCITLGFFQLAMGVTLPLVFSGAALVGLGFGTVFPTLNHWAARGSFAGSRRRIMAMLTAAFHVGQFMAPLFGAAALMRDAPAAVFLPYAILGFYGLRLAIVARSEIDAAFTLPASTPNGIADTLVSRRNAA
ncbi:MAG: MFS transporter [Tropicimonas sp.]|uniref:MFS transporter n=1 Tax=Tropicimonas sp. TaxID=2067044 RepID=UPI003A8C24B0